MALPQRMKFGIFMAPFHRLGENPTLSIQRDLELIEWLDYLDFDEAWIGEHHSAGWEIIASPEVFIAAAAERTKYINLGTGVTSLPYHHPLLLANRMVVLDHMTRGRAMLGVGPGALTTDAYILGIDPSTQRRRMDEGLGVIMRLLKEEEPITYESDWFSLKEATLQLRSYTQPHLPIAVAAGGSPAGMVAAGKYGAWVLSHGYMRPGGIVDNISDYWKIAEEAGAEHGNVMKREDWRLVMHVHLAETRKEAFQQARVLSGKYQREYFEQTLGQDAKTGVSQDEIIDVLVERGAWCVGTPDDLIAAIERLGEESGGFGGLLIQATEWGTREQVMHSYELLARYVMPRFQNSLHSLTASREWAVVKKDELADLQAQAKKKAAEDYARSGQSGTE